MNSNNNNNNSVWYNLVFLYAKLKAKQMTASTVPITASRKITVTRTSDTVSITVVGRPSYGTRLSNVNKKLLVAE